MTTKRKLRAPRFLGQAMTERSNRIYGDHWTARVGRVSCMVYARLDHASLHWERNPDGPRFNWTGFASWAGGGWIEAINCESAQDAAAYLTRNIRAQARALSETCAT